ncbi:MAG: tRNA (adenosine(37)-N6)-threonylcarbamoyltransferase complex dimerization subunit type 1 TsaB [Bacteroidota bacterium]
MPLLLHIETATTVCSVALSLHQQLISIAEIHSANSHSSLIATYIVNVCKDASIELKDIDAVCVSKGPGSYTGLRIGVSAAKGLCFALDKPLISVETLQTMAQAFLLSGNFFAIASDPTTLLCPMIDARRMEVYCALYDASLNLVQSVDAIIIDQSSFDQLLPHHKILFFGDGAAKCRESISHPNAIFIENFQTSAKGMISLAEEKYKAGLFENLAYFEPFYLKEFIAGKPRVKGLQ